VRSPIYNILFLSILAARVAHADALSCPVAVGKVHTALVKREAVLGSTFILGGAAAGLLGKFLGSEPEIEWSPSSDEQTLLTEDIGGWTYSDLKANLPSIAGVLRRYFTAKEAHKNDDNEALSSHFQMKNSYPAYFVANLLSDRTRHNSGWVRRQTVKDLAARARELGLKFPTFEDPGNPLNEWMKQFEASGTFSRASDAQVEALLAQALKSHVGYAILASVMLQSPDSDNPVQVSQGDLQRGQALFEERGILRAIAGSRVKENTYLANFLDHPPSVPFVSEVAVRDLYRKRK
jgi:hypothetical protein